MSIFAPIGLTGGIASGKSTVSGLFRAWGAFVADADDISRHALDPGTACYERTVAVFGRDILFGNGTVDRKKVAGIVFGDPQALADRGDEYTGAIDQPSVDDHFQKDQQGDQPMVMAFYIG